MKRLDLSKIDGANYGKNSFIECDEFIHQGEFSIGDNVDITSKKIYLGSNTRIGDGTKIHALKDVMTSFYMGDESEIGFNSQVMVPGFEIGDYTRIFNSSLCSGYKPLKIGHNCWFGQSTILNSTEMLEIGNNVRMGVNSQVWTHVASGELLEGCRFFSEKAVIIEENVWLVGSGVTVSPGVRLAKNTIVMPGSVVSKSTEAFHTYSGIPAVDITSKLNGWNIPTPDEKFVMLKGFVEEFIKNYPTYKDLVFCLDSTNGNSEVEKILSKGIPSLIFLKEAQNIEKYTDSSHSIFDLKSKTYTKRRTDIEIDWMKFSIGYRARFIPFTEDVKE